MLHGEKITLATTVNVISMVETWMNDLEKAMINTLEGILSNAYKQFITNPKTVELELESNSDIATVLKKKLKLNGQCLLTMTNYSWRVRIERELIEASKNEKKNIDWDQQLNLLGTAVAGIKKLSKDTIYSFKATSLIERKDIEKIAYYEIKDIKLG